MATFTLNVDTAETIFAQNDQQNGFVITTTATPGLRTYRISRERNIPGTMVDFFDFTIDLSSNAPGSWIVRQIPYYPSSFSVTPTPRALPISDGTPTQIDGEIFKLLSLTPTVENDPTREIPSYINLRANYAMSGLSRPIKYIYFNIINEEVKLVTPLGNIASDDHYGADSRAVPIDPTKTYDMVEMNGIIYQIVRMSTTPTMIISKGTTKVPILSDTYTGSDGLIYTLTASGGGAQTWNSATGLRENGFYAELTIVGLAVGALEEINAGAFRIEPQGDITLVTATRISNTGFRFLLRPRVGVTSVDLKIYVAHP